MTVEELVNTIKDDPSKNLLDAEFFVRDLTGEGNHFEAFVVSDVFEKKSRLERHAMVMKPVQHLLNGPLHALTIKTYTKHEMQKEST